MKATWYIPQLLTLGNVSLGALALIFLFQGEPKWMVLLCIAVGALCDLLDGMVARLLNVPSEFGLQLDSLADMVSFGVVPGMLAFHLFPEESPLKWGAILIVALSAWRLAKFNVTVSAPSPFFNGLATPAHTLFWLAVWYIAPAWLQQYEWALLGLVGLGSWLLVSNVPFLSFKMSSKYAALKKWQIALIPIFLSGILIPVDYAPVVLLVVYGGLSVLAKKLCYTEVKK